MTTRGRSEMQLYDGCMLGDCHRVEAFLGQGGFGVVAKCRHINTNKSVAIKVNKNDPDILEQARQEIKILTELRCLDPQKSNIVQWNGFFFFKKNICLNFELLDLSLHDYMEDRPEGTLPMTEIKDVLYQLSVALSHLSSIGVVHADLKPDNVMVVDRHQKPIRIKLIDFGLANYISDFQLGMCVQTTWYRAPEVCLYSQFNEAIDIWSLGLTAAELAVGYTIYPGETDYDVLSFIIATQGPIPDHVLDQGPATQDFFNHDREDSPRWRLKSQDQYEYETGIRPEDTRPFWLSGLGDLEELMLANRGHNSDHALLVDLIKRMMNLDPEQRIKPQEVMQHPFITGGLPQNSGVDVCNDVKNTEEGVPETNQPPTHHEVCSDLTNTEEGVPETNQPPTHHEVCSDLTNTEEGVPEINQPPTHHEVCSDLTNTEEGVPEINQPPTHHEVCSNLTNTEEGVPETNQLPTHHEVCSDLTNTEEGVPQINQPPTHHEVCIDMADIEEDIPEESEQPSCSEVSIDMTDIEEAICSVQRENAFQAAETENIGWFRGAIAFIKKTFQSFFMTPHIRLQSGNATLAADSEDAEIQPERKTKTVGFFGKVVGMIGDTYQFFSRRAGWILSTSGSIV